MHIGKMRVRWRCVVRKHSITSIHLPDHPHQEEPVKVIRSSDWDAIWESPLWAFWARLTRRRPWGRPRTHWRHYISWLAFEHVSIPLEELEVVQQREVWASLLRLLLQMWINESSWMDGWMDGWMTPHSNFQAWWWWRDDDFGFCIFSPPQSEGLESIGRCTLSRGSNVTKSVPKLQSCQTWIMQQDDDLKHSSMNNSGSFQLSK